jgi:hypothetical protein
MKIVAGFWYTFLVVVLSIGFLTGTIQQYYYVGGWNNAPLLAKIGIPLTFITFIGFWIMMLEDFIENKTKQHRVLIGLSLFFLHWIAILVYFWAVVYHRKAKES